MFNKHNLSHYKEAVPGIRQKTLVYGEKTLMVEFILTGGYTLPQHSHPYEQTGYLVSGHVQLQIGDEIFDTHAGDSWCIHVNVPHGAKIMENSVAVEIFSPVRKEYLPDF